MVNLVFLEAAINSDDASIFVKKNSNIIDFATREVDALVEEQTSYICSNVGEFIESDAIMTYDNIKDPISDIMITTTIFGDIIATSLSDFDKREMIEGCAHIISMEGVGSLIGGIGASIVGGVVAGNATGALAGLTKEKRILNKILAREKNLREQYSKTKDSKILKQLKILKSEKAKAVKKYNIVKQKYTKRGKIAGSIVSGIAADSILNKKLGPNFKTRFARNSKSAGVGIAGSMAGSVIGAGAGKFAALFSKDRKAWKTLVKEEDSVKKQYDKTKNMSLLSKLSRISKAKDAARNRYLATSKKMKEIGTGAGALIGGVSANIIGVKKIK